MGGGGCGACLPCPEPRAAAGRLPWSRRDNPGRELVMLVERNGQQLSIPVTPVPSGADGSGRIGIQLAANADIMKRTGEGPVQVGALGRPGAGGRGLPTVLLAGGRCERAACCNEQGAPLPFPACVVHMPPHTHPSLLPSWCRPWRSQPTSSSP